MSQAAENSETAPPVTKNDKPNATEGPLTEADCETTTIGENGVVRIVAFSAGGMDSIFEFGMVHAFLISNSPRPHITTGISTGAVVAGMLADVLQAGENLEKGSTARQLAQVARFRAQLEHVLSSPDEFKEAALPDFTEVSARAGLSPLELPTQPQAQKDDRKLTAFARFGLTRLFNSLLASRIKFRESTRIIRLVLELQALDEWRWNWLRRRAPTLGPKIDFALVILKKIWTAVRIWVLACVPVIRDAPLLLRLGVAPGRERVLEWAREKLAESPRIKNCIEWLGWERLRSAKKILFEPWNSVALRSVFFVLSYPVIILGWVCAPPAVATWLIFSKLGRPFPKEQRAIAVQTIALLVFALAIFLTIKNVEVMGALWTGLIQIQNFGDQLRDAILLPRLTRFLDAVGLASQIALGIAKIWLAAGAIFGTFAVLFGARPESNQFIANFLDAFGIKRDLLTTGVLRKLLMRTFDPHYYGKRDFNEILNEALGGRCENEKSFSLEAAAHMDVSARSAPSNGRRFLADWIWGKRTEKGTRKPKDEAILVAPVAADVATGELIVLPPETAIVDAMTAACAMTPLFRPLGLKRESANPWDSKERWLIDGASVGREPIQPVLNLVKKLYLNRLHTDSDMTKERTEFAGLQLTERSTDNKNADVELVDLCIISPFPTQKVREQERVSMAAEMTKGRRAETLPDKKSNGRNRLPGALYRLYDILSLQATHAAKDERTLVEMYNDALKKRHLQTGEAFFCSAADKKEAKIADWHVRANLREVEPEKPVQLGKLLARCGNEASKRTLLLGTIADGCRCSFLVLYRKTLIDLAERHDRQDRNIASSQQEQPPCQAVLKALGRKELPGNSESELFKNPPPPGITEICKECKFYNDPKSSWKEIFAEHSQPASADWGAGISIKDLNSQAYGRDDTSETKNLSVGRTNESFSKWPTVKTIGGTNVDGKKRPIVSLVFSGGVFRGVFQVGVLNAYCMAGLKPDLVAGASVGTIIAAMSARVFDENNVDMQARRVASLAATFLAVDRLVLTDRFADFIRRFTLRAGAADFSLRDADHLFRQFDKRNWERLSRRSRQVLAGIHRLTYVDPLELLGILSMVAPDRRKRLADRVILFAQDAMNRAGIGSELLGAEPLEQLITAHILDKEGDEGANFQKFLPAIQFMATTTNLTTGELDVLGSFSADVHQPALVPGLLASSAFPAVFRPRMNWELRAGSTGLPQELVDGGIADNLPIVPVYRFLACAAKLNGISPRPSIELNDKTEPCPHLLLTASLEPRKRTLSAKKLKETVESWPALRPRVSELKYNVKVDSHRQAQQDLRKIRNSLDREERLKYPLNPTTPTAPDLHISCIKPAWLCGTFAFHPMLGFKRERQAASIAHGCASAFAHLHCEQLNDTKSNTNWTRAWWTHIDLHDGVCNWKPGPDITFDLNPRPCNDDGDCCFVKEKKCPFSEPELKRLERIDPNGPLDPLGKESQLALNQIYRLCGRKKTHE